MSYAGPSSSKPIKRTVKLRAVPVEAPQTIDWQQVAMFGAGLALGIAVGAGAALLSAPHSGFETRARIRGYAAKRFKREDGLIEGQDDGDDY